jgi:hypothetical protein
VGGRQFFSLFQQKKLGEFFFGSASSNHFSIFIIKILPKKRKEKQ